jgi:hypothetical protein
MKNSRQNRLKVYSSYYRLSTKKNKESTLLQPGLEDERDRQKYSDFSKDERCQQYSKEENSSGMIGENQIQGEHQQDFEILEPEEEEYDSSEDERCQQYAKEENSSGMIHVGEDQLKSENRQYFELSGLEEDFVRDPSDSEEERGRQGIQEEKDVLQSPKTCTFYLDEQEWKGIKPTKKRNVQKRKLRGNWTTVFNDKFFATNKTCVLKFTRNTVKKRGSRKAISNFFVGKAECKFSGCCSYTFLIKKDPGDHPRKVKVNVLRYGTIQHQHTVERRQLKGAARAKLKQVVGSEDVLNTYYQNIASLSEIEIQAGNLTNAPTKDVLQNLRKEGNYTLSLSKDPVTEVILTGEILRDEDKTSKSILGYVQFVSIIPFSVVLFTEKSIQILRRAIAHRVPLHLDATGSVVRKIPGQEKPVFYYALVMKEKSERSPVVPVAEMITNSNTTVSITHFLGKCKEASMRLGCRSVSPIRVEVDFSWPLINSVLLVFNSENMIKYLQKCWNILSNSTYIHDTSGSTVVHICAFHMMGIMKQKFGNIKADKKLKEFGKFCFALLQNSASVDEGTEIPRSICQVLKSDVRCKTVENSLSFIKTRIGLLPEKPTDDDEDQPQYPLLHDVSNMPMLTESTIRKSSPFELHFMKAKEKALSELTEEGIENEYYSPDILGIFETYMYLYPLWSGAMLKEEGITRDTNANVENWFGVVKNSILQKKRNLNAGMFIRKMHVQIAGRTAECNLPLEKKTRKNKNIENLEEVWQKTPQKQKKSKYFQSPNVIPSPRKKKTSTKGKPMKHQTLKDTDKVHEELPNVCRENVVNSTTDSVATSMKRETHPAYDNEGQQTGRSYDFKEIQENQESDVEFISTTNKNVASAIEKKQEKERQTTDRHGRNPRGPPRST